MNDGEREVNPGFGRQAAPVQELQRNKVPRVVRFRFLGGAGINAHGSPSGLAQAGI